MYSAQMPCTRDERKRKGRKTKCGNQNGPTKTIHHRAEFLFNAGFACDSDKVSGRAENTRRSGDPGRIFANCPISHSADAIAICDAGDVARYEGRTMAIANPS